MSLSDEIDAISDKVLELEQENERLQGLVDSLTEQLENQAVDENVEHLLEVIATYRQIRPK